MYKYILIFIVSFQLLIASIFAQTNLYVSNQGNDQNNGSMNAPVRSLKQALTLAKHKRGHVSVFLRAGTYYLDTTLIIRATDFHPSSLTIRNYKTDSVVISGGKRLALEWKPYKNGILVARVSPNITFDQLFVNDEKQVLARYPNYDSSVRILKGTSADAISKERVSHWANPAGGYLHGLQAYQWGSLSYKITGKKQDGSLQLEGGWQNNRPSSLHKEYRYVEGIFEELDTVNELFLDRQKGVLYYYHLRI